jgi:hypothetical protein
MLAEELKEQSASRQFTIKRLGREKLLWFHPAINTAVDQLLETDECGDLKILGKAYVQR